MDNQLSDNQQAVNRTPEEKVLIRAKEVTLSIYNTPDGKEFFKLFERISGVYSPAIGLSDAQLREQEGKRQLYVFFKQFIGE